MLVVAVLLWSTSWLFAQSDARLLKPKPEPPKSPELEQLLNTPEPLLGIAVVPPREGWTWTKDPSHQGMTITMNSFGGQYMSGGIIPKGGAEVALVAAVVTSLPNIDDLIAEHFEPSPPPHQRPVKVAGCRAVEADSELRFGQVAYKRLAVFMPLEYEKGSSVLYKFLLSYNLADQGETARKSEAAFHNLLSSVTLKVAPKRGCAA